MPAKRDNSVILKIDNLTNRERVKFTERAVTMKSEIAPKGRATLFAGKTKDIGNQLVGNKNKLAIDAPKKR